MLGAPFLPEPVFVAGASTAPSIVHTAVTKPTASPLQYAMCPVIDLANHSSYETVRGGQARQPLSSLPSVVCLSLGAGTSPRDAQSTRTQRTHHSRTHHMRRHTQAEVSYDYFRDAFVVAAGRGYEPGQQVRRLSPHSSPPPLLLSHLHAPFTELVFAGARWSLSAVLHATAHVTNRAPTRRAQLCTPTPITTPRCLCRTARSPTTA